MFQSRTLVFLALPLVLGLGCKKKPVGEPLTTGSGTEAPAPKASEAPAHVKEMAANFQRVFFEFDSSSLDEDSKGALNDNIAIMQKNSDVRIEIQGHADERGTTDYNIALGQKRAASVTKYMKSQGISDGRIKVVSYGEERPLDGSSNERAWSKNRRCEFVITWSGEAQVQGTTP